MENMVYMISVQRAKIVSSAQKFWIVTGYCTKVEVEYPGSFLTTGAVGNCFFHE